MATEYLSQLMPEPVTVLGFTLKDFSLGHLLLFQNNKLAYGALDNAVAFTDPFELFSQFVFSVVICALSYEEFDKRFSVTAPNLIRVYRVFKFPSIVRARVSRNAPPGESTKIQAPNTGEAPKFNFQTREKQRRILKNAPRWQCPNLKLLSLWRSPHEDQNPDNRNQTVKEAKNQKSVRFLWVGF